MFSSDFISEAFILIKVLVYKMVKKLDTRWKANKAEVMIAVFCFVFISDRRMIFYDIL